MNDANAFLWTVPAGPLKRVAARGGPRCGHAALAARRQHEETLVLAGAAGGWPERLPGWAAR